MIPQENISLISIPTEQLQTEVNLLQSDFWARFKAGQGWTPLAFKYKWREVEGTLLVLYRKIARFLPVAYVPLGPLLPEEDKEVFLRTLSWHLLSELPLGTLFIRYDLIDGFRRDALEARHEQEEPDRSSLYLNPPLKKAIQDVQPPDTVILSLEGSEEEILGRMHKKWRYNIRLAAKKGVEIRSQKGGDISEWYSLYKTTSERDHIALHSQSYYQNLINLAEDIQDPEIELLTAWHEDEMLAGIIVVYFKKQATYLYGASSNHKRNLMPAYLLQWEAIQRARDKGCLYYDLYGCSPSADPDHPMHGLFFVKTGFGGELVHRYGAWDYPYGKIFYFLYRMLERMRLWYFKKFKKRSS